MAEEQREGAQQGSLEEQLLAAVGDTGEAELEATMGGPSGEEAATDTPSGDSAPDGVQDETAEGQSSDGSEEPSDDGRPKQLIQWMKDRLGADYAEKYQDDLELLRGLDNAVRLIGQRNEDAQLGRMLREDPEGALRYLREVAGVPLDGAGGQQPQAAAADRQAQQQQAEALGAPRWDPKWEYLFDAEGKPRPDADPAEVRKAQKWATDFRRWQIEFAQNPESKLAPLVEQKAREILQQELGAFTYQMNDQMKAQQFVDQNKEWLFEGGQVGGNLTEAGKLFYEGLQEAAAMNVQGHDAMVRYATNYALAAVKLDHVKNPSAAAPPTNPKGAKHQPSTAVPDPEDEPDMREDQTLEQAIESVFKRYGTPAAA